MAKAVGGDKGIEPREPAANGAEGQATRQHQEPPAAPEPFFRTSARDAAINQRRFGIAYLVLAIAVGVAVGLGIVLVGRGGSTSSARGPGGFAPRQQGELGAREIANQVMHEYKGEAGDDFVAVVGQRPSIQNVAIHDDLIRPCRHSDAEGHGGTPDRERHHVPHVRRRRELHDHEQLGGGDARPHAPGRAGSARADAPDLQERLRPCRR